MVTNGEHSDPCGAVVTVARGGLHAVIPCCPCGDRRAAARGSIDCLLVSESVRIGRGHTEFVCQQSASGPSECLLVACVGHPPRDLRCHNCEPNAFLGRPLGRTIHRVPRRTRCLRRACGRCAVPVGVVGPRSRALRFLSSGRCIFSPSFAVERFSRQGSD